MKIVAVSQSVQHNSERNEIRDSLDQRLIQFLLSAGYFPVPVSSALCGIGPSGGPDCKSLAAWLAAVNPDAVVLSGGNDIGQWVNRDITEIMLLDYAQQRQLPLLGICRGMQMIANWAGIGLRTVKGHVGARHMLSGQISRQVNSYHEFSIASCPDGFEILATSEDSEIEAIENKSLGWEGWMWHPEREETLAVEDLERINSLFGE